jgi:hypothetical protein
MRILVIIILAILIPLFCEGQFKTPSVQIRGDEVIIVLEKSTPKRVTDSLVREMFGLKLSADSLWRMNDYSALKLNEWKLRKKARSLEFYKPVNHLEGQLLFNDLLAYQENPADPGFNTFATFGFNKFKKATVKELPDGHTLFWFPGKTDARIIHLSGSFNLWSVSANPMIRTDSGWVAKVRLSPGKVLYKFIIDGYWREDRNNMLVQDDGHSGFNSVYFKPNYVFTLKGYSNAKSVYVTGSFNAWQEKEVPLQRSGNYWNLAVYLKEGTHNYKFIVDGAWINDPENKLTRPDGKGNLNSVIAFGETVKFHLKNYKTARKVTVAGDFNSWEENELQLVKTDSGWTLPYVLAAGNYNYKFIVDGKWITDPSNPHFSGDPEHINSFLSVRPNVRFFVPATVDTREVRLAGTFNGWDPNGYTLVKRKEGWEIRVHLKPGKYLYKFLLDGNWAIDPGNPLWEENEYGTGNSVLWINQDL